MLLGDFVGKILFNVIIDKLEYPKLTPGKNLDGNIAISLISVFSNRYFRNFECKFKYKKYLE